ncbi:ninja-family protein [Artemisia annua]|uniref:Ninja-family protein n=1 Tax=Artemisia annua TaxID=35608 RepID=A0A2U1NUU7_ARTAN|nr:ninja-family protein [Artemisia annua]
MSSPFVSQEMNLKLQARISTKEAHRATKQLGGLKAPDEDGFSGICYHKYWHLVGDYGSLNKLMAYLRQFFWGGDSRERHIHWKSWEKLTDQKVDGDISFRNLESFNKALLAKTRGETSYEPWIIWEGVPPKYPAIRPGIAAELRFGGSGSSPNPPWVSTTGSGPNGKTISCDRYSGSQMRIVCACHGSHLSPEEFVQHASEEQPNQNSGSSGLPSFPNSNPAASAQN